MQWSCHCVLLQIDSVGVFVWALAPFFVFGLFSAVCFAVSAGDTQVWLGDLRVVVCCVVVVSVCQITDLLIKRTFCPCTVFVCLLTCKDRAISATSATLEEKKWKHTAAYNIACNVASECRTLSRHLKWSCKFCHVSDCDGGSNKGGGGIFSQTGWYCGNARLSLDFRDDDFRKN